CACPCRGRQPARSRVQLQFLRRLGLVRVLGAGVDLQFAQLRAREAVAREHAFDRLAQHLRRPALELGTQRPAAETARIAGVAVVHLGVELVSGHVDLLRVHDDDEIACVDVRRVLRLGLATERVRDLRSQTPERLAFGIDEVPAALDLARLCSPGLHAEKWRALGPPTANRSSPSLKSAAPPWLGWRTYGASRTASASRPTAITLRPRASSRAKESPAATSADFGARLDVSVPGCVGTTFQSRTCSSSPSSARTRWTIVALASAGPWPVSWRSEVNGTPE